MPTRQERRKAERDAAKAKRAPARQGEHRVQSLSRCDSPPPSPRVCTHTQGTKPCSELGRVRVRNDPTTRAGTAGAGGAGGAERPAGGDWATQTEDPEALFEALEALRPRDAELTTFELVRKKAELGTAWRILLTPSQLNLSRILSMKPRTTPREIPHSVLTSMQTVDECSPPVLRDEGSKCEGRRNGAVSAGPWQWVKGWRNSAWVPG